MYEVRLYTDNNVFDVIGRDDTFVQALARLKIHSGAGEWTIILTSRNEAQFNNQRGDVYSIASV